MQVFTARVRDGAIVLEDGVSLPEGTTVTVIADHDDEALEATPDEERQLLEAIAEAERGETIRAADLLERLRRESRGIGAVRETWGSLKLPPIDVKRLLSDEGDLLDD
jgi:hypothetical protein